MFLPFVILQNGSSGLLVACQEGHLETVKAFLAHSARVDVFEEVSFILNNLTNYIYYLNQQ